MIFSTRFAVRGTLSVALATTGCGTVAFTPGVQSLGEYKNTQAATTAARTMDPHVADDVKVLVETLTLTMWSWFVPTYYPCRVAAGTEEERRADIVETLQKATKALGGNLVVVAGFGGVDFVTVNGKTGAVVASNSVSTLNGMGYAFKARTGGASTGAPAATPAKGTTRL